MKRTSSPTEAAKPAKLGVWSVEKGHQLVICVAS